jgi:Golgi phosphoprotein 3
MDANLSLGEALYLLALDDTRGTVGMNASSALPYGLAGAALLDLALRGRLTFAGKNVVVSDATPTGDDILDDALTAISGSQKQRSAEYWITHLQKGIPHHRDRLLARLVARGILRHEEDRILGIFPRQRYPEAEHTTEFDLKARLRSVVLAGTPPAPADALLLSLIAACRLDGTLFTGDERKVAKQRVRELTRGEAVGKAVADALTNIEAGVTTAVIAATAGGSVASH